MIDISEIYDELFIFIEKDKILVFKNGILTSNHKIKVIYITRSKGKVRIVSDWQNRLIPLGQWVTPMISLAY